jgi:hypothetical protein
VNNVESKQVNFFDTQEPRSLENTVKSIQKTMDYVISGLSKSKLQLLRWLKSLTSVIEVNGQWLKNKSL